MKRIPIRVSSMVLVAALLAMPIATIAHAQTPTWVGTTPTRIANIWGWQDHQPTETQVQREEKADGVFETPAQESLEAATLDQINRQLLH